MIPEMEDSRPEVIYIIPYPDFFSQHAQVGGHNAHVFGVIQALSRLGKRVTVFSEDQNEYLRECGAEIALLPMRSKNSITRFLWSRRLIEAIVDRARARKPAFYYMRYSAGFSAWMPSLKPGIRDCPWVVEVNSFKTQRFPWMRFFELRALRCADLILCVSERVRQDILDRLSPELDDRTVVIPNGVDMERFDRVSVQPHRIDEVHIGYGGLIKPHYGLEVLIDAFSRIRRRGLNCSLHLYGDGPHQSVLKRLARNVSGVYFRGARPFQEMPAVLKELDILVYTTSRRNAFQSPIKMYEYMAAARPIVAARTPQTEALIGDDERGLLYEIGDAQGLADRVEELIRNPELGAELARRAHAEVAREHTWEDRVARILEEVEKL